MPSKRHAGMFLGLAAMAALALGCGGGAAKPNIYEKQETASSRRALAAYEAGRDEKALAHYKAALKSAMAVENLELTAINMINLATVLVELKRFEEAETYLGEVLAATHVRYPTRLMAEAALVKSQIALERGDLLKASQWSAQSLDLCRVSSCGEGGRIHNVMAAIDLKLGRLDSARRLARAALTENQAAENPLEQANSHRLLGDILAASGEFAPAQAAYQAALGLDKAAGLSPKLALDLARLGVLMQKMGDHQAAAAFFKRAYAVSVGGGDQAMARYALEMIEKTDSGAMDEKK